MGIINTGCPSLHLPSSSDIGTCHSTDKCSGISCCVTMDVEVTQLSVNAWLSVDPCDLRLSVGLGSWTISSVLSDDDLGVENKHSIGNTLKIRYINSSFDYIINTSNKQ